MNSRRCVPAALALFGMGAVAAADTAIPVYTVDGFAAEARISDCASGCTKQMQVTAKREFVFNGNYNDLYNELLAIGVKVSVYDSTWQDSENGELVYKFSSTVHQRQLWRRGMQRRKVDNPTSLANAIYETATPGGVVTLEFLQAPVALSGDDFTINVRRYQEDTLLGSGSRAVTRWTSGGDGTTYEQ